MTQSGQSAWMFAIGPSGSGRNNVDNDDETVAVSDVGADGDDGCNNVYIAATMAMVLSAYAYHE